MQKSVQDCLDEFIDDGFSWRLRGSETGRSQYVSGIAFILIGVYLSYHRRRVHPLLLMSISALSFSYTESPYDWAMYAQFPPGLPRLPSWWPLNVTWGGLPSSVPKPQTREENWQPTRH
jgi:hypothetical protein